MSAQEQQAIVGMSERVGQLDPTKRREFWAWLASQAGAQLDRLEGGPAPPPPNIVTAPAPEKRQQAPTIAAPAPASAPKKRKQTQSTVTLAAAERRSARRSPPKKPKLAVVPSSPHQQRQRQRRLSNDLFAPTADQVRELLVAPPERMWTTGSELGRAMWERCLVPALCFGQNREDKTHALVMRMLFEPAATSVAANVSACGITPLPPKGVRVLVTRYTGVSGTCQLCHSTHPLSCLLKFGAIPGGLSCGSQCAERFDACANLLRLVFEARQSFVGGGIQDIDALAPAFGAAQKRILSGLGMDGAATRAQRTGVFGGEVALEERAIATGEDLGNQQDADASDDGDNDSDADDTKLAAFVASEGDVTEYSGSEEEEEEEEEEEDDGAYEDEP
jgi:hypothetical protein